jgi:hypothetical protein
MKMSAPTNVIITSIAAVSGSSTQPSLNVVSPRTNQSKLCVNRAAGSASVFTNATHERKNASTIDPMASEADAAREGRFINALNPAASSGSAGISQRYFSM